MGPSVLRAYHLSLTILRRSARRPRVEDSQSTTDTQTTSDQSNIMAPATSANHDPALTHPPPPGSIPQPSQAQGGVPASLSAADLSNVHLAGLNQSQILSLLQNLPGVFNKVHCLLFFIDCTYSGFRPFLLLDGRLKRLQDVLWRAPSVISLHVT